MHILIVAAPKQYDVPSVGKWYSVDDERLESFRENINVVLNFCILDVLYSVILRLKVIREKEKVEENQLVLDHIFVSFREIVLELKNCINSLYFTSITKYQLTC